VWTTLYHTHPSNSPSTTTTEPLSHSHLCRHQSGIRCQMSYVHLGALWKMEGVVCVGANIRQYRFLSVFPTLTFHLIPSFLFPRSVSACWQLTDYSARRISDWFLPNAIDLINEALRLTKSHELVHRSSWPDKMNFKVRTWRTRLMRSTEWRKEIEDELRERGKKWPWLGVADRWVRPARNWSLLILCLATAGRIGEQRRQAAVGS